MVPRWNRDGTLRPMNDKDRRLAAFCQEHGYDGVHLRRRSNIAWASDGADVHCDASTSLGVASLLWTPLRKLVITDVIEAARLREEEFGPEWEIVDGPWWAGPPTLEGRLVTDYPEDCLTDLRSPLTGEEIGRYRRLGREAARAVEGNLKMLGRFREVAGPLQTERWVAGMLAAALSAEGIASPVLLVAADDRIARYRHPIPTGRHIERVLMVAVCAERDGLIVSLTRLVHFGPIPEELRRRHDAVCRVDAALQEATRPGVRWCDALGAGIRAYAQEGFGDEWEKHHQGGPTGYEARDFKATPTETRAIQPAQAVAWNPSITGTKSEDTVLTTGEVLTATGDWPMNPAVPTRPDILRLG
jgi:hypothetical protein